MPISIKVIDSLEEVSVSVEVAINDTAHRITVQETVSLIKGLVDALAEASAIEGAIDS
jgi:hypothetical protein